MSKPHKGTHALQRLRLNIVLFVAFILLALVGGFVLRSSILTNSWDSGMALAQYYAEETNANLSSFDAMLSIATAEIDDRLADGTTPEGLEKWLNEYYERMKAAFSSSAVIPYIITDDSVLTVSTWVDGSQLIPRTRPWYEQTLASDGTTTVISDVYTDAATGRPVITIAQRCQESNTVLAFDIFPETFQPDFDLSSLHSDDSFYLCDSSGAVLYRKSKSVSAESLDSFASDLVDRIEAGDFDESGSTAETPSGLQVAVYYSQTSNGWYSIVTTPYSRILEPLTTASLACAFIVVLFSAIIGVMTWRDHVNGKRLDRTSNTVRVLGNSYFAIYLVNYAERTYEMVKGSDHVRARLPEKGDYQTLLETISEVIEPEALDEFLSSFSPENIDALVSRRVRDFGGDFRRLFDGTYRWVSVRVLYDESLAPQEAVLCFRMVEQEKQQQLQERKLLEDALESSRRSEQSKQAFFNNMSHDMRTPLNAIVGLCDLAIQQIDDRKKAEDYLAKIKLSSQQLLSLVNDILDISHMEQGEFVLEAQRMDLVECIKNCTSTFEAQAHAKGKEIETVVDVKDRCVIGDPTRLAQILNNLVSNALKFTSAGDRVRVSVEQASEHDGKAEYTFTVSDTGIGMSKDFLPRLFESYARENRFGASRVHGTGLGMPITKNLVGQMGGTIHVESQLDEGTTFTIVIPFALSPDNDVESPEHRPKRESGENAFAGLNVLVVEDNEVNMEIAVEMLSMMDARTTSAWNGQEALDLFRQSDVDEFDVVLMDMQMPVMDGCEAAKRIRALHREDARRVPIVAVTANAFSEDIAATAAAGMDAHVSKPIDFAILSETLEKILDKRENFSKTRH